MNDPAQSRGKLWSEHLFIKMAFSFLINFGLIRNLSLSDKRNPITPKKKTKTQTKTSHPAPPSGSQTCQVFLLYKAGKSKLSATPLHNFLLIDLTPTEGKPLGKASCQTKREPHGDRVFLWILFSIHLFILFLFIYYFIAILEKACFGHLWNKSYSLYG